MKNFTSLASIACSVVVAAGLIALSAGFARAQDPAGEGAHSGAMVAQPNAKIPPADIGGPWSGTTADDSFGDGSACFQFTQNKNGSSIVKKESGFSFEWSGGAYAYSPVGGHVKGMALKFNGNASQCPVKFLGVVNNQGNEITGSYSFGGQCKKKAGFSQGTFDVTATSSPCTHP
ncbi:MAG: hypothetical protein ACREQI_10970 [Candidatus Binataceae bacterium]